MLEDLVPPARVRPCAIRDTLANLDDTDGAILKAALFDFEAWSARALSAALTARGLPLGEKILRERRAKPCDDCTCRQ